MNIAIIGAGNVGAALASTLRAAGHELRFGLRDPASAPAGFPASPVAEAVQDADLVILAVPARAAVDVVRPLGHALAGRILVDATNPVGWQDGPTWAPPVEGSVAAALQAALPDTAVVKAWSTFGAEFHARSTVGGQPVTLLLAGDDARAKETVSQVGASAGYAPVDAGPLRNAALLEAHAVLWIHLALKGGQGRRFTFQLVHDA